MMKTTNEKEVQEPGLMVADESGQNGNKRSEKPEEAASPAVPEKAEQANYVAVQLEKLQKLDRIKTILIAVLAVLCVILTVALIVSVVKKQKDSTVTLKWEVENAEKETKKGSDKPYEPRTDVFVQCTYVSGSNAYIIVRNDSNDTLIDYTVAYIAFDAAGNVVNSYNDEMFREEKVTTANLVPGTCSSLKNSVFADNNVKYIQATLTYAEFKNGEVWQATGINGWAEKTVKEFTVDGFKNSVERLKDAAQTAQTCPYLSITKSAQKHSNQFSDQDDLQVTVKNIGEKTIKSFSLVVAEYDANNYSTKYLFPYFTPNSFSARVDSANIQPGKESDWYWKLIFSNACKSFKCIIQEIEFDDGTMWQNPNVAPWLVYNEQKR